MPTIDNVQPGPPSAATVTVGQVVDRGVQNLYNVPTEESQFPWADYQVNNYWTKPRHLYQMAVASPAGFAGLSCAFIQLTAPTLSRTVDWTASRIGRFPKIPDPRPSSASDWVLIAESYENPKVVVGPDGSNPIYRISGTYVYGKGAPSALTADDIRYGVAPELDASTLNTAPGSSVLATGIIDPSF